MTGHFILDSFAAIFGEDLQKMCHSVAVVCHMKTENYLRTLGVAVCDTEVPYAQLTLIAYGIYPPLCSEGMTS